MLQSRRYSLPLLTRHGIVLQKMKPGSLKSDIRLCLDIIRHIVCGAAFLTVFMLISRTVRAQDSDVEVLKSEFRSTVIPFLNAYCLDCHGRDQQEAKLNLSGYTTLRARSLHRTRSGRRCWNGLKRRKCHRKRQHVSLLRRIEKRLSPGSSAAREHEARRNAGDPGFVLARRLSNAEYNASIRDLTGSDIRPTRTFPVDPANAAGFDNSGESLAMSPALLRKYLASVPRGRGASGSETGWNCLCIASGCYGYGSGSILCQTHRGVLSASAHGSGRLLFRRLAIPFPRTARSWFGETGADCCQDRGEWKISEVRLVTAGQPGSTDIRGANSCDLQKMWPGPPSETLQPAAARRECERMRDYVIALRSRLRPRLQDLKLEGSHVGSQPFVLWKNRQYVANRRTYDRDMLQVGGGTCGSGQ